MIFDPEYIKIILFRNTGSICTSAIDVDVDVVASCLAGELKLHQTHRHFNRVWNPQICEHEWARINLGHFSRYTYFQRIFKLKTINEIRNRKQGVKNSLVCWIIRNVLSFFYSTYIEMFLIYYVVWIFILGLCVALSTCLKMTEFSTLQNSPNWFYRLANFFMHFLYVFFYICTRINCGIFNLNF